MEKGSQLEQCRCILSLNSYDLNILYPYRKLLSATFDFFSKLFPPIFQTAVSIILFKKLYLHILLPGMVTPFFRVPPITPFNYLLERGITWHMNFGNRKLLEIENYFGNRKLFLNLWIDNILNFIQFKYCLLNHQRSIKIYVICRSYNNTIKLYKI
jgi:hypothetical protein